MVSFGFGCLSLFELVLVVSVFLIGLCWAVLVVKNFIMLRNVALAFHCWSVVVSATFSSCKVVFGSFKIVFMCIFCRLMFFGSFEAVNKTSFGCFTLFHFLCMVLKVVQDV